MSLNLPGKHKAKGAWGHKTTPSSSPKEHPQPTIPIAKITKVIVFFLITLGLYYLMCSQK